MRNFRVVLERAGPGAQVPMISIHADGVDRHQLDFVISALSTFGKILDILEPGSTKSVPAEKSLHVVSDDTR